MAVPHGQKRAVASGWSAVFPVSVAVFKSGHDLSTPLGMTAEEKERKGHDNSSYPVRPRSGS